MIPICLLYRMDGTGVISCAIRSCTHSICSCIILCFLVTLSYSILPQQIPLNTSAPLSAMFHLHQDQPWTSIYNSHQSFSTKHSKHIPNNQPHSFSDTSCSETVLTSSFPFTPEPDLSLCHFSLCCPPSLLKQHEQTLKAFQDR